jgi:ElaB/YqjD/DUF883 family membrane-anchored ribosome-binding protein
MQDDLKDVAQELVDELDATDEVQSARRAMSEMRRAMQDFIERSGEILRDGASRARDAAGRASARTADYVQERPLRAVLIAAAVGAVVALMASGVRRRRRD